MQIFLYENMLGKILGFGLIHENNFFLFFKMKIYF